VRGAYVLVTPAATLTLSVEHRLPDGAVGAQLLSSIKEHLEDPLGLPF
jgi:pyruvate/2-oxoglutarate dehydrogenase complex dihydrolipoamide acyltransferase (E2) component